MREKTKKKLKEKIISEDNSKNFEKILNIENIEKILNEKERDQTI